MNAEDKAKLIRNNQAMDSYEAKLREKEKERKAKRTRGFQQVTRKEALGKIYSVKGYASSTSMRCQINVPPCLYNLNFKLVVVK